MAPEPEFQPTSVENTAIGSLELQQAVEPVWAALNAARRADECLRVLFVGPSPAAGSTLVSAATALGLAQNLRLPTRLVETDLMHPHLADYFQLDPGPGTGEILASQAELSHCLREVPGGYGLQVVPAGRRGYARRGEFATPLAHSFFEQVGEGAAFLLIDGPPVLQRVESRLLFEHADGVVLVVRARADRRADVRAARDLIEEAGLPIFGAVLNRFRSDMPFGIGG